MLVNLRCTGEYHRQNFVIYDKDEETKFFDTKIKHSEIVFTDKFAKPVYTISYNNTAVLVNQNYRRKQKAWFEIFKQSRLLCKVDYIPNKSKLLGIKLIDVTGDDELYIRDEGSGKYSIFNMKQEIVAILLTEVGKHKQYTLYTDDVANVDFYILLSILIDTVWITHASDRFTINYTTNFTNQNPKTPKLGEFKRRLKELKENS